MTPAHMRLCDHAARGCESAGLSERAAPLARACSSGEREKNVAFWRSSHRLAFGGVRAQIGRVGFGRAHRTEYVFAVTKVCEKDAVEEGTCGLDVDRWPDVWQEYVLGMTTSWLNLFAE